jgi:hypothetical protein
MATGRVPTTANSPLTAKGDLFTYSTAPARLAVGNNGESLVADSAATTGLRYQGSTAAGRNFVINGGMDIWQRGTSFSLAASAPTTYLSDRWCATTGANQATTVTRQVTGDTTNLPNLQYALRWQRNSGQTGTAGNYLSTSLETVNSIPLAGQTVTFSFYARKGANYSPTSNALSFGVYYGTGTDQNFQSPYTGITAVTTATATLTATWQRFTATGTVASTATELAAYFLWNPTGTAGAADYYEIAGIQLELGSVATTFTRTGGTIQGELAACQRYYFRSTSDATTPVAIYANGTGTAATSGRFGIQLPVTMRTTPTSLDYANLGMSDSVNAATAVTVLALATNLTWNNVCGLNATTASGITTYRPYFLVANSSANAYVGLSAEL